jgi:iron complex transport system substrate-binding protein
VVAALCVAWLLAPAALAGAESSPRGASPEASSVSTVRARRIVSINPSLTAIVIALGASETLVGVDDYSAALSEEVKSLPRVGGLFSPSLEAVVALQPDMVVLVPSAEQRDFRTRLEALGIRVSVFDNISFDQVLENISRLGAIVGREDQARSRIAAIERTRAAAARVTAKRPSPRVLLVIQRDQVFVAGSGSFIDEMLGAVGATNVAQEFADPYPRVAIEWVVARAPEVMIDLSEDAEDPKQYWSRWPSIPAVRSGRVIALDAELISMPGPHLDRSLEILAGGLYGVEVANEIEREKER